MTNAIFAFLHHLAAFTLAAALLYEFLAFRRDLSLAEARRIQRVDIAYGVSAAVVLTVGLLRVFYFEKGEAFYAQNWFFWVKMAGFTLAGLVSIYPTVKFVAWNKFFARGLAPEIPEVDAGRIKLALRLELLGIVIILFSAAMMARGIGMM